MVVFDNQDAVRHGTYSLFNDQDTLAVAAKTQLF